MENHELVFIEQVAGAFQAEMLRGLLEAQGISAILSEESAAVAYGLTVPAMGKVQILVRAEQAEAARQVLADYYAGKFDVDSEGDEFPEDQNDLPLGKEPQG